MKKILFLLLLILLLKLPISAQTPFWTEDFTFNMGWNLGNNWAIEGGKMEFNWSPTIQNFDEEAVSPVITLHESIGELIVTQYLDVFATTSNEVAEIYIIHETGEDILWSYPLSNGSWGDPGGEEIEFSVSDYAGQDVQFKFRTFGATTYNWNWWDIFELRLTAYMDNDLSVTEVSGPVQVNVLETGIWEVEIKNTGLFPQSDFTVKLFDLKTGELIGSIDDFEQLEPQSTKSYSFEWYSSAAYNTAFYGVVVLENDEFEGNNVSNSFFVRVNPDIDFNILVWDNDNSIETVVCPEKGDEIQPSTGLTRALDDAEYEYDFFNYLPENLNDYDIIFSTMGCFCVS